MCLQQVLQVSPAFGKSAWHHLFLQKIYKKILVLPMESKEDFRFYKKKKKKKEKPKTSISDCFVARSCSSI